MRILRRAQRDESVDINVAPMVDMIFILLIFFLATASFVRESGVDVQRPAAASAETSADEALIIGVTAQGALSIEGERLDIRALRPRMERFVAERPGGPVVVVADRDCPTGITVRVLDACRLAGVRSVSLGARAVKDGYAPAGAAP
ncbi:Biopolymer transport protein ExbD/TolR [Pseudodesulfovibrio mercurii]|uniref:Biopolymer transport protein ExbD/TolR n=1 Tax=Pseudodesulfovibrio mercurii TaxID=641491 RepID=F0JDU6_9BACT|nr:biopolymer transporter ExbD [Pseudodesulfovibrio mercurii]EGB14628.1 Biopolymer transport protein ExbD/TolR [Pseudodesulfovibrio mercurii]